MLALTLWPEWAWCVCYLGKRVENRAWLPSPAQLRPGDRFAIHAGAAGGGRGWADRLKLAAEVASDALWLEKDGRPNRVRQVWGTGFMLDGTPLHSPSKAVLAFATYLGPIEHDGTPWCAEGQFHWGLGDVVALPRPAPCRGSQGLWRLPADVERQVLDQVGHA